MGVLFAEERKHYHERLLQEGILTIDKNGVPSNADKASKLSVRIAAGIAERLMAGEDEKSVQGSISLWKWWCAARFLRLWGVTIWNIPLKRPRSSVE